MTSAEAAALLGVGVSAIKRWADSSELACVRTAGGHRRFTLTAVEAFRAQHASSGGANRWGPWLDALQASSGPYAVMALLYEARAGAKSWPSVLTLVGELLGEIGHRWAHGALTVAQEHVASATLARALGAIAETMPVGRDSPQCLLASAEGDDHTLGLSLGEVCLREAGWAARWVGAPTSTRHLVEHVRDADVQMVALSASSRSRDRRALANQARRVGDACRAKGAALVLGGAGQWPEAPSFGVRLHSWEELAAVTKSRAPARDLVTTRP